MNISPIKRPWDKPSTYGHRTKRDPFYQSREWKDTKKAHKAGFTTIHGQQISNMFCYQCYLESKKLVPMWATDHVQRIEDGGSRTDRANLRSLCESHHNAKSAREGNEARTKVTSPTTKTNT